MPKQTINIGAAPDDGTGDPFRTAFQKARENFDEIYAALDAPPAGSIPTVYMSPAGSNGNPGTAAAPVATPARALELIGRSGRIVMMKGDYFGVKFDLSETDNIQIAAQLAERVRVFLGEKKTTFINHTGSVWKTAITTAIPADVATPNNIGWVFQEGTPEGAITDATALPIQKQRSASGGTAYRLEHFRLKRASSLGAIASGQFWYQLDGGVPTIYIRRTDDANPNSVGTGVWLPNQNTNESFVFGGSLFNHVEVEGVEVYFARKSFDFYSFASAKLKSCLTFGSSDCGVSARICNFYEEYNCEHAAHASDGMDGHGHEGLTYTTAHVSKSFLFNTWAHDNGDQGISSHGLCEFYVWGGLLEHNGNGGCLGFANVTCHGVTTRNNVTCGFSIIGGAAHGNILNVLEAVDCHSIDDENGYYPNADSKIIVRGGSVRGATTAAFNAQDGTVIEHCDVDLFGNAKVAETNATGTVTANVSDSYGSRFLTGPRANGAAPLNSRVTKCTTSAFSSAQMWWQSTSGDATEAVFDVFAALGVIPQSNSSGADPQYTRFESFASSYHEVKCGTASMLFVNSGYIESEVDFHIADGKNLVAGTSTGSQIGTAANQKLGFWGADPVVQPAAIADSAEDLTELTGKFNDLLAAARAMGLLPT